MATNQKITN